MPDAAFLHPCIFFTEALLDVVFLSNQFSMQQPLMEVLFLTARQHSCCLIQEKGFHCFCGVCVCECTETVA